MTEYMLPENLQSIEQALSKAGWDIVREALIAPGRYKITGDVIQERTSRADYLLKYQGRTLAVVETVSGAKNLETAMAQAANYARQINLPFAIATDGYKWSLLNFTTGKKDWLDKPPSPEELISPEDIEQTQSSWGKAIAASLFVDDAYAAKLRPYQENAIAATLQHFAKGNQRASLLMSHGVGMTYTIFQLVWKMLSTKVLENHRVLFVSNRLNKVHQAYQCFEGFGDTRCLIDGSSKPGPHHNLYFATVQTLCHDGGSGSLYEDFDSDYYDLIIFDDCRSMMGSWSGVLSHFKDALQLGMMNSPELKAMEYFGEPVFVYSMAQAINDGYLLPFLLEGRQQNFEFLEADNLLDDRLEQIIVMEEHTRKVASDLWNTLSRFDEDQQKTIVFCVNNSHAALMTNELTRISRDPSFAAHISASQPDSQSLIESFRSSNENSPRVAVSVNLLTGVSIPDVSNIVLARPIANSAVLTNLIALGALPCGAIGKRFFTVFDYYGSFRALDTEWVGTPENAKDLVNKREHVIPESLAEAVQSDDLQGLAESIRDLSKNNLNQLFQIWVSIDDRSTFRDALGDRADAIEALKRHPGMSGADEVDVLADVGFGLKDLPSRKDRVRRFWKEEEPWLRSTLDLESKPTEDGEDSNSWKLGFWTVALDHYSLYGIEPLERGRTYQQSPFVNQFGSFQTLTRKYGGPQKLRADLEAIKSRLFVPIVSVEDDFE